MNEAETARKLFLVLVVAVAGLVVASWAEGSTNPEDQACYGRRAVVDHGSDAKGLFQPIQCLLGHVWHA